MDFISKFDVLLLDVGHTFMIKGYRFFNTEDFAATYRGLGGEFTADELVGATHGLLHKQNPPSRVRSLLNFKL